MSAVGRNLFQLSYQISPIILVNGIASGIWGGMMPIISITESADFVSLLSGANDNPLDNFFAQFEPLPGSTLIAQQIGMYPFANQAVAANATIEQPLKVSLVMKCPARSDGIGYTRKLLIMTALQTAIRQHNNSGGTYIVATPAFLFTDLVMADPGLTDVTTGESNQVQYLWRWDFIKPLITLQQAAQAQNNLMSKITNGLPSDGSTSGPDNTVGFPPSLASSSAVPAGSNLQGTAVGPIPGQNATGFP